MVTRVLSGNTGCEPRSFPHHSSICFVRNQGAVGGVHCIENAVAYGLVTFMGSLRPWRDSSCCGSQCGSSEHWHSRVGVRNVLCLPLQDVSEQLADPERVRGLEKPGSSSCGGDQPPHKPMHRRLLFQAS